MPGPILRLNLKIITSALVVAGVVLMAALPFMYRYPPETATRQEMAWFGIVILAYIGVTSFVWLAAAFCSILLIRQRVKEIREVEEKNLRELVEGSLRDHQRRT